MLRLFKIFKNIIKGLSLGALLLSLQASATTEMLLEGARVFLASDAKARQGLLLGKNIKTCIILDEFQPCSSSEIVKFKPHFTNGTRGLFIPSTESQPINYLFLSVDAGLWTFTHEYLHALINEESPITFDEQKEAQKMNNAMEDLNETFNFFRSQNFLTENLYQNGFSSLRVWIESYIKLSKRFELEEVKIESILRTIFYEKEFKDLLSIEDYNNSTWYIKKNCTKVLRYLEVAQRQSAFLEEIGHQLNFKVVDGRKFKELNEIIEKALQEVIGTCPP